MTEQQFSLFPELEPPVLPKKALRESKLPIASARDYNANLIKRLEIRAFSKDDARFGPCLKRYLERYKQKPYEPIDLLSNLTEPLLDALKETNAVIRKSMIAKWEGKPDAANQTERSVANSLRRTAGTNYQGLVSYALARFLLEKDSAWYVSHPVPKEFQQALIIAFTGGIPVQQEEDEIDTDEGITVEHPEEKNYDNTSSAATVKPDVDVLLRNYTWQPRKDVAEPIVILSLKTSLVDRAGMAARWKIYFDLATQPCCHQEEEDCAYRRLGIQMENANQYAIHHGIVTANIYKLNYSDPRYQVGELTSGQTQSNTYMFKRGLKLTTRDDSIAITPDDWKQFPHIATILKNLSRDYKLPG
jgi:hypothetical protein